jgi:ABC-type antimicrobial peptide transport system permease subunit
LYPAWWASRLLPLEALSYEGGSGRQPRRRILGGMTIRNLWQRRTRTVLTSLGIGVGIAAIVALNGIGAGFMDTFTDMVVGSQADLMALEADASDMGYSSIDERTGARLAAMDDVEAVSGIGFAYGSTEEAPIFLMMGYNPREFGIQHFKIVEGQPLQTNRQMMVGKQLAESMGMEVGDTFTVMDSTFRIVGIYETGAAFEESGAVITLRDAQRMSGRPRQVSMMGIKVRDPDRIEEVRDQLAASFPEIDISMSSDFAESIPDMERMDAMVGQMAFMAMMLGALTMLNTMLMSVLERTQEIGVLRALGWRRRQVMGMIVKESLVLGIIGGLAGLLLGMGFVALVGQIPVIGGMVTPTYGTELLIQAMVIALLAGTVGGLYPAWRATRMRPVEALRYE